MQTVIKKASLSWHTLPTSLLAEVSHNEVKMRGRRESLSFLSNLRSQVTFSHFCLIIKTSVSRELANLFERAVSVGLGRVQFFKKAKIDPVWLNFTSLFSYESKLKQLIRIETLFSRSYFFKVLGRFWDNNCHQHRIKFPNFNYRYFLRKPKPIHRYALNKCINTCFNENLELYLFHGELRKGARLLAVCLFS